MAAEGEEYTKFFTMLFKRLHDYKHIHHVQKALLCIDYCVMENPDSPFAADVRDNIKFLQKLTRYRYYIQGQKEIGLPVRELACKVIDFLQDEDDRYYDEEEEIKVVKYNKKNPDTVKILQKYKEMEEDDVDISDEEDDQEEGVVGWGPRREGFQIMGCIGDGSRRINGEYELRDDFVDGKKSYKRVGGDSDPIVFWFWEEHTAWMITKKSQIHAPIYDAVAYALIRDDAEEPLDIVEDFLIYDTEEMKFNVDQRVQIHPTEDEEDGAYGR